MAVENACDGERLVDSAEVAELLVMAVEDASDGGRIVDSVPVAGLAVMAMEDAWDGGRLVDNVTQVELIVMECVAVEIEERVLEDTEVVADEVAVPESLISSVEQ